MRYDQTRVAVLELAAKSVKVERDASVLVYAEPPEVDAPYARKILIGGMERAAETHPAPLPETAALEAARVDVHPA